MGRAGGDYSFRACFGLSSPLFSMSTKSKPPRRSVSSLSQQQTLNHPSHALGFKGLHVESWHAHPTHAKKVRLLLSEAKLLVKRRPLLELPTFPTRRLSASSGTLRPLEGQRQIEVWGSRSQP